MAQRLPTHNEANWDTILEGYLGVSLNTDGTLKGGTVTGPLTLSGQIYRNDDGASFGETGTGTFLKFRRVSTNAPAAEAYVFDTYSAAAGTAGVGSRLTNFRSVVADGGSVVNRTVTGATNASPIVVTAVAHGFANGDKVAVYGVVGNTAANGAWVVANKANDTFELAGSTGNGAYSSGGIATNRPMYYAYHGIVAPSVARGGLTGTAQNGDDIACFVGGNAGTAKATDAFYLARNAGIGGSEWTTGFTIDANCDYGIRLNGTFASYGLDFTAGTFTGGMIRLKNNSAVYGRNNANSADLELFRVATTDVLLLGAAGATTTQVNGPLICSWSVTISDAVNVTLGTTNGTKFGLAANQRIGFHNATPVVQHATTGETVGFTAGGGTTVTDASTFTGNTGSTAYRISDIVKCLKAKGLMAS